MLRVFLLLLSIMCAAPAYAASPGKMAVDATLEAFAAAAVAKDEPKVQQMMAIPGLASMVDKDGHTALFVAAHTGRTDLAETLVAQGSDIDHRDARGTSVLFFAAAAGQHEMVDWLLARRPALARAVDPSPLDGAIMRDHAEIVAALLRAGAPLFTGLPANTSSDALDMAVVAAHIKSLRVMLDTDDARRMPQAELDRLKRIATGQRHAVVLTALEEFERTRGR